MTAERQPLPPPDRLIRRVPAGGITPSRRRRGRSVVITIVLLALAALYLTPFFWMVFTSLKTEAEVFSPLTTWLPKIWVWANYPDVFSAFPFWRYLLNTMEIAVPSTIGTMFSSAAVAYAFSHMKWRGRDSVFWVVMSHMMIPIWVTIIPLYVIFVHIHWINTYWPLIVPNLCGGAFNIFMLRQFFLRQPTALLDAARMDGASEWRIFFQIVLPLAKPALTVVALFSLVWSWTDFFGPLIFLTDPSKYTLMLGLASLVGRHITQWPQLMAANIMVVVPLLALFFVAQKQFIEGIHLTGMTG